MFSEPINPEVALQKGVEIFWSTFLYSFLIIVSFWEYRKYYLEGERKKEIELEEKNALKRSIEDLKRSNEELKESIVRMDGRINKEIDLL